jgi:hypothetical protein
VDYSIASAFFVFLLVADPGNAPILRFTIRDILWLTVVVAVAVLFWGEYRQRLTDSAGLRAENLRLTQEREYALSLLGWQHGQQSSPDFDKVRTEAIERGRLRLSIPPP